MPVARVTARHYAVEQIDPSLHCVENIRIFVSPGRNALTAQTDLRIGLGSSLHIIYHLAVYGDHYVTLVVQTPDKLKPEAKELLKQFDALTGDSLNAVKNATEAGAGDSKEKDPKDGKKKKFWK